MVVDVLLALTDEGGTEHEEWEPVYGISVREWEPHLALGQRNSPVQHSLFSTWIGRIGVFSLSLTPPPLRRHRGSCLSHRQLRPVFSAGKH